MPLKVFLTTTAKRDIQEIYRYVATHDSLQNAERLVGGLQEACAQVADFPERGNIPKELLSSGITEYREAHYKPYRIVYRTAPSRVVIYCVLDGRRDMQTLLLRRLLR
jgi:toxin ParE1/3/4